MLWACLRLTRLALDALHSGDERHPHAVVDGAGPRRRVVLSNEAAARSGVRSGQPVAGAQLLCPRLAITPRDETAERQALETFAAWAYRYSADVSLAAPDALFFEIGASLGLFDGWPALERRMRDELDRLGFGHSLATAPTASAARVFATCNSGIAIPAIAALQPALAAAPLVASGLASDTVAMLHGMGLRVLGDLFRLPRPELARRIGPAALDHLDRLRGLAAETLPRWQPLAHYERRVEFPYGIESQLALAFPLQRMIREFALFLAMRDGGTQRFELRLEHEGADCTRIEVGLLAPQRDAASLFDLARVRLERITLAAPVHALALCADDLPTLSPLHRDLFETNRREQLDWPALVERLRARLGDASLHGLACVADHRPGRAWAFAPLGAVPAMHPVPAERPFWLLQRPQPLPGRPQRVLAGPERIESGWWDERDQRRDYYVVEMHGGRRAWAFVEAGFPRDVATGWTVHGWFA
jgi:protein ImuB